jgi:ubiquitin C-terminal hydrolase
MVATAKKERKLKPIKTKNMKNLALYLNLCNECDTVYDEKMSDVPLNADEFSQLEREQFGKWKCPKCVTKENKEKLITIIQNIPETFTNFERIEFVNDKAVVTVKLNDTQVLTTKYNL